MYIAVEVITGGVGDYPAATTPEPEHDTFAFAPSGSSRSFVLRQQGNAMNRKAYSGMLVSSRWRYYAAQPCVQPTLLRYGPQRS